MKVAFDTETRGLDWWKHEHRAFLGSWADGRNEYVADLADPEGLAAYHNALKSADLIVAHNLSFDVHQTRQTGLDILSLGAKLEDTDLMSRVIFPEGRSKGDHSLKGNAERHLSDTAKDPEEAIMAMAKEIGYRTIRTEGAYYDVWRAYPEQMEHYARMDARYTYDLHEKFSANLSESEQRVIDLEHQVAPVLIRAEQRGIALDQERVAAVRKQFQAQQAESRDYLERELGEAALGGEGSEDALIEALQMIGVPLYQKTKSGEQLSTAAHVLGEFTNDFEQIAVLQEYRQANKFLSTYLDPMVGRDVIHTSFSQCEAWTGRMSSRRPNMQNIPVRSGSEVRSVLVPREGHCFIVCDYDSIEVRFLAHYLGDKAFRDLIADGHDPHAWMASQIHGGEMAVYEKGAPLVKLRGGAKESLFAIVYGAGGKRITEINDFDPGPFYEEDHPAIVYAREQGRSWPKPGWQYKEGRAFARKIKDSLPRYHRLNKRIKNQIQDIGHVNTYYGRRNPVNKDKSYVGMNALIQGSAADAMKLGTVYADELVRPLGATPLLVVHDELVVECPIEHAEECLALTKQGMEQALEMHPPLKVTGGIYYNSYAEAKD